MQINLQTDIPTFEVPRTQPTASLAQDDRLAYYQRIKKLLKQQDAVLVAHYYTDPDIQRLAEETGGVVSDSLEMARFGQQHSAKTLVVAGVYFMGETAKILSPQKRVLMPTLDALCSLDLSCPADQFEQFCQANPDRKVVVYANTSASVKALADWVVTSSIAVDVVDHLAAQGEKIIWAPDRYLGDYIAKQTQADMLIWQGACVVHEEFKAKGMTALKALYPDAAILVHPESPAAVIEMADVVGSTSQLINSLHRLKNDCFIVATDRGILYKMQQVAPGKSFIEAPTGGEGATCRSCAHCPWMAMNSLQNLEATLRDGLNEIQVDPTTAEKALLPLERMVKFQKKEI